MLDNEPNDTNNTLAASAEETPKKAPRRRATKAAAAPNPELAAQPAASADPGTAEATASVEADTADKPVKAVRKAPAKKAAPRKRAATAADSASAEASDSLPDRPAPAAPFADADLPTDLPTDETGGEPGTTARRRTRSPAVVVTFQAPEAAPSREADEAAPAPRPRRRRGRRGRGGRRSEGQGPEGHGPEGEDAEGEDAATDDEDEDGAPAGTRRRRRRTRTGTAGGATDGDEDVPTVVHVREPRPRAPRARDGGNAADEDGVRGISGSTRMAAKRVRRQEGRDSGRKRAPIVSEAEFLARREAVDRQMVVRQKGDRTQIAVLEDGILVEHYVTKASATSYAGNVYLGRVQNVLPSMEAAFVDVGKGRNAVLYAGEVNWEGMSGGGRKIEQALKSGQEVLVQVSKDPIGHKGARLTSQISLPGRYLVYVPESSMTGISRKLPENERTRLKNILKNVVPESAGVIIRTAAEGVSEEEIAKDVRRLQAQWEVISTKAAQGGAPALLHAEPDLVIKVVRDIFNEDFTSLLVQGESEWETIREYVEFVAPDLAPRLSKYAGNGDVFAEARIDEQLLKALDRKVFLPSGGSLVIDRTEAMVVVDVNTGKYVGKGGNLEETVTRNNLEAAEEIARQLRLRDLGGIIVVDFIDMVLESNRDLVVRRLVECLGRDRTKHQVAEVTSLGLVQMTRKRVGQGLLESFSETCEACNGRGVKIHMDPIEPRHDRDRDRAPRVGPKAPVPAGAAPADDTAPAAGGSRNRRRRGGRGQASAALDSAVDPATELTELLQEPTSDLEVPDADAAEQAAEVLAGLSSTEEALDELDAVLDDDEVPVEDALEQNVEVVLEPDSLPVPTEEPVTEQALTEEPAAESGVPVKKRRRATSKPAGPPTASL